MQNLIEIVQLLSARQIKSLEIFHPDTIKDDDSQYAKFYRNIEGGVYSNDEDAARDLYNAPPSDKRYQMLKSRVRKRLLNSLFFLDMHPPITTRIGEAHYEAAKTMIQASYLDKYGAVHAGAELAKKNLARAREIQMTEVEIFQTKLLKRYTSFHGDNKEHKQLSVELTKLIEVYSREVQAENFYDEILSELKKTAARETSIAEKLIQYIGQVDYWRKTHDRFVLHKYYYFLRIYQLQFQKNFKQTVEVCNEFEKLLLSQEKFYQKNIHIWIASSRLYCSIHLRDLQGGSFHAEQYKSLCSEQTQQWSNYVDLHFLHAMQSQKWALALDLYNSAINSRHITNASEHTKEKWRIYKAYFDYTMLHVGRADEIKDDSTIKSTEDLENFVRELPTYSKDKRGFYVSIIIVQILFMLEWGNIDGIIDRIESIKRYIGRYLRRPEYHRSYCFMKLLLIMEKKNFDPVAVRAAGKRYYEKLTPSDNQDMSALDTLEIIPLDDLWVNILRTLERLKKQGTIV